MLEEFLSFYLSQVSPEVMGRLAAILPNKGEDLTRGLVEMFTRTDREALGFQLDFFTLMAEVRHKDPRNCIMFDDSENICYPFFIHYAWLKLPLDARRQARNYFKTDDVERVISELRKRKEARDYFRFHLAPRLTQEDLFVLNELIALINFSSGGESSFLTLVYPHLRQLRGKVLDAGCGAGLASLIMSQHLDVVGVDACRPRINRARMMADLITIDEQALLSRIYELIRIETGEITGRGFLKQPDNLVPRRKVEFLNRSLDDLDLPGEEFDAIVCLDVLEHTYNPAGVMRQFARLAKPGALLFLTVPNANGELYQRLEENSRGATFPAMLHLHHWEPESLTDLAARHGFGPVKIELFDPIPDEVVAVMTDGDKARLKPDESGYPLQVFAIFQRFVR